MSNKDVSFPAKPPKQYSERATQAFDGLVKKPEPTKRVCVDLPLSLHFRVKIGSIKDETSITKLIRDYLEKKYPELD